MVTATKTAVGRLMVVSLIDSPMWEEMKHKVLPVTDINLTRTGIDGRYVRCIVQTIVL